MNEANSRAVRSPGRGLPSSSPRRGCPAPTIHELGKSIRSIVGMTLAVILAGEVTLLFASFIYYTFAKDV